MQYIKEKTEYIIDLKIPKKIGFLKKLSAGFTIIEVIVVVGIMSVIMAVVLFNSRDLASNLALSGVSQEISLVIRQAQSYGISVRESSSGLVQFNYGYGAFFDLTIPNKVFIYIDKNNDGFYDGNTNCDTNSECVERVDIKDSVVLNQLCVNNGSVICSGIKQIHINFTRPNPEPRIRAVNYSNTEVYPNSFDGRVVFMSSNSSRVKTLIIDTLGKITVQ